MHVGVKIRVLNVLAIYEELEYAVIARLRPVDTIAKNARIKNI